MLRASLILSSLALTVAAQYSATYHASPSGLPDKTENGQTGTNKCGQGTVPDSQCQNAYLNAVDDFCLWAPPVQGEVAAHEGDVVAYCTKPRGTRAIPPGAVHGVQFIRAPSYVQVTGTGDFTSMNIVAGDSGGELDPHGADGTGNPKGGIVFHCENGQCFQMHEWMQFMSANEFCFRACWDGPRATSLCRHTYDELGCGFNVPASYPTNQFESCESNDAEDIAFYGGSYFAQDMTKTGAPVPPPHQPPQSSQCYNVDSNALYGPISGNPFGGASPAPKTSTSSTSASSSSLSSSSSSTSTSSASTSSLSSSTSTTTATSSTPTQVIRTSVTLLQSSPTAASSGSREITSDAVSIRVTNQVGMVGLFFLSAIAAGAFAF